MIGAHTAGRYAGTCIGGPLAGRRVISASPYYQAATYPPLKAVEFDANAPITTEYNVETYKHDTIRVGYQNVGLWIPENWNMLQALGHLLKEYGETAKANGL